jgi:hypothetical protein
MHADYVVPTIRQTIGRGANAPMVHRYRQIIEGQTDRAFTDKRVRVSADPTYLSAAEVNRTLPIKLRAGSCAATGGQRLSGAGAVPPQKAVALRPEAVGSGSAHHDHEAGSSA